MASQTFLNRVFAVNNAIADRIVPPGSEKAALDFLDRAATTIEEHHPELGKIPSTVIKGLSFLNDNYDNPKAQEAFDNVFGIDRTQEEGGAEEEAKAQEESEVEEEAQDESEAEEEVEVQEEGEAEEEAETQEEGEAEEEAEAQDEGEAEEEAEAQDEEEAEEADQGQSNDGGMDM